MEQGTLALSSLLCKLMSHEKQISKWPQSRTTTLT